MDVFFYLMFMSVMMVVFAVTVLLVYLLLSAGLDRLSQRAPAVKDPPMYTYKSERKSGNGVSQ